MSPPSAALVEINGQHKMREVLIHCFVGGNRSVAVAVGYMLLDEAWNSH